MNSGQWAINAPGWMVVATVLLTLILPLIWVGLSSRKDRRWFRWVFTLAASLALAAILLEPTRRVELAVAEAVLITEGSQPKDLRNLRAASQRAFPVFVLADSGFDPSFADAATVIPDLGFLARRYPEIKTVHVLGFGLEREAWQGVQELKIVPHLASPTTGFSQAHWPAQVELGQEFLVDGQVENISPGTRVLLEDPGGERYVAETGASGRFRFTVVPRALGRFAYRLVLENPDEEKTYQEERLPLTVVPPRRLDVLILADAPSFEIKYLRDWLNRIDAGFLIQARISKDRYRWEEKGHEPFTLLDRKVLSGFDVVLADRATLQGLAPGVRNDLAAEIQNGLSLLVAFEQESKDDDLFWPFDAAALEILEIREVSPRLAGLERGNTIPVDPYVLNHIPGQTPLIEDFSGRVLAASLPKGSGKIATSLIRDTHQWVLEGHGNHHEVYWSHLFSHLARPTQSAYPWRPMAPPPYRVDRRTDLVAFDADGPLEVTTPSTVLRLPTAEDPMIPEIRHSALFPSEVGWHEVAGYPFFVGSRESWRSLTLASRTRDTLAESERRGLIETDGPPAHREEVIWPGWFVILFLAATTVLWLERKLARISHPA